MKIASNSSTFRCEVEGPSDAPWLMLAHGVATDLSLWDGAVSRLAERYRILRYDTRGHGGSAATSGGYSFDLLCRDVIGIMDTLDIERAHFCGLSLGGMTALGLALDHADRLSSATVCNARADGGPQYRQAWADRAALVRRQGIEAVVEPSIQRWLTPGFVAEKPDRVEAVRAMVRRTSADGYCGAGAALSELAFGPRLFSIRVPVLYLTARQDEGAPLEVVRAMHERTPGSSFTEIDRAGHLSVVEQPEAVAEAILAFLDRVEADGTRAGEAA